MSLPWWRLSCCLGRSNKHTFVKSMKGTTNSVQWSKFFFYRKLFSSVSFLLNIFIHHSHWTITIWHTPMTFYVTLLMINESFYFLHLFDFVWKSICNNKSYIISFFSILFELCTVYEVHPFLLLDYFLNTNRMT